MRRKTLMTVCLAVCLLLGTVVSASAADSATLTITPDRTEIVSDGGETKINYTITVTPPAGQEIGVFSFRLKPSGQMTLGDFTVRTDNGLPYDVATRRGVFRTYEYTAASAFFAAVGSTEDQRMKEEAEIMTITATIPAGVTGAFVMDAEFTVAPDGSGNSYTPVVICPPVTVTGTGGSAAGGSGSSGSTSGSSGGTGSGTASGTAGGTNVAVTELDRPAAGEKPDTQVTVVAPGQPEVTTSWTEDGAAMDGAASFRPGHVYTVTIRVKTNGAAFDASVYTNAGYTLERVSDTELLLHRSFYVQDTYTKDVDDEEAQQLTEKAQEQETDPSGEDTQVPTDDEIPPDSTLTEAEKPERSGNAVLIAAAVLVAAAVVVQFAVPGGWKRVFGKKENTIKNNDTEGEGKQ